METSTPVNQTTAPDAERGARMAAKLAKQQTSLIRENILAEAKAAGQAGIHVNDLAARLNLDSRYLRTWLLRIPALRKVSEGRYRFIELPLNSTPYPIGSYRQQWTLAKRELKLQMAKLMEENKLQREQHQAEAKAAGHSVRRNRFAKRPVIIAELKNAGDAGILVKDLAGKVGLAENEVAAWLRRASQRKLPAVEQLGKGLYRFVDRRTTPAFQRRQEERALLKKTAAGRGSLKARILAELNAAGAAGVKVKILAKKLGLSNWHLGNWFAITGKRPEIERIGCGTYRLRMTPCKGNGELTAEILAGLKAAGPAGIRVRELAVKLGLRPFQVEDWFCHTAKKLTCVERIKVGTYRLIEGPLADRPTVQKQPAFRRARGRLTEAILAELKAAGEAGVSLKVIAKRLHLPCHNVRSWYQTTGRRIPGVEQIGWGVYRFNPGNFPSLQATNLRPSLTPTILSALKAAGPEGLHVQDLKARIGLTKNQVRGWFDKTGKKVPGVERIGWGVYRFNPGS